MDKILLIDKPVGIGSTDVVRIVKRSLGIKKVGHCGTLDPLAEGLLIVVTGKACKIARFIEDGIKEYIATITFGKSSLTLDAEGPFSDEQEVKKVSTEAIDKVLDSFVGNISQTPPIYSALKVDGKRLYEYARENKEVEIKSREVKIYELELINYDINTLTFRCVCSKGTYIRTLAQDIASKLDNLGYVSYLKRTAIAELRVKDANSIEDIKNGNFQSINMYEALKNYKMIEVSEAVAEQVKQGKTESLKYKGQYVIVDKYKSVIAMCENNKILRGLF